MKFGLRGFGFGFLDERCKRQTCKKSKISTIINEEHIAEISSWIDYKSTIYSLENVTYKLQLILRENEDGFQLQTFWNMCNEHAGMIVVVKVAGTDEILGGYNPLA
ncbi:hypothetical protein Glove_229g114 [Diversispora epigaea]|uniref:TLDc domain-containing protein n=1 Tax=Diversispora epigaea TaxID=1348612 RepID=A0A397IKN0_9GLOM|nr:hypothetical protein Glove_229g114 [Diversispora epigaea]